MNRNVIITLLTILLALSLWGENELLQVAVLDSTISGGTPQNISPMTANYVSDTIYKLGKYGVIPRNQLYFAWVGAPSSSVDIDYLLGRGDYNELGRQLSADIICLLSVEQIPNGYRLTGELIQAESSKVLSREQTEAPNILSLIEASKLMGEKLSGAQLSPGEKKTPLLVQNAPEEKKGNEQAQQNIPAQKTQTAEQDEPEEITKSTQAEPNRDTGAFGSFTLGLIIPQFTGGAKSVLEQDMLLHKVVGSSSDITGGSLLHQLGMNMNLRVAGDSFFCFDFGMNLNWEYVEYEGYSSIIKEDMNFSFIDLYMGPGVVLSLGGFFQASAGATLGYGMLEMDSTFWDDGSEIAGGLTLGYNVGLEARTPGGFVFSVKYMGIMASELEKEGLVNDDVTYYGNRDFGFSGFQISMGTTL